MLNPFVPALTRASRAALIVALAISTVCQVKAEGEYQKTKDGKTFVWNSAPRPGDTAKWVGDRNREGYARGFGTLTWYTATGQIFARYYGNMVDGKFDGPVNAHSKGKVAHATFVEGKKTGSWTPGNATLRGGFTDRGLVPPAARETPKPEKAQTVAENKPRPIETPAAAAKKETKETPAPEAKPESTATPEPKRAAAKSLSPPPTAVNRPTPELFPKRAPTSTSKRGVDESLQSLVGPPSSLHNTHPTDGTEKSGANGPLNKNEVVDMADTVARTHGYNPANYTQPSVQHNESDDTWALSYDAKDGQGSPTGEAKHFSITVDGKTKRASITGDEHKDSSEP